METGYPVQLRIDSEDMEDEATVESLCIAASEADFDHSNVANKSQDTLSTWGVVELNSEMEEPEIPSENTFAAEEEAISSQETSEPVITDDEYESDDETAADAPFVDIRKELTEAFSNPSLFKGSFASSHTYKDAPNPGLFINGLGGVGLPLSERDASDLIAQASQAPFGQGERTIIDKEVRDTWEIDGANVNFENPLWHQWLQYKVLSEVQEALALTCGASLELYKLLIYEAGSHFLAHQDTEKAEGMFGTLVILLPSKFSGGELQLSHAGRNKIVDVSASSMFSTTVMSWYTDVFHEIKPVQSGYRLALSYKLVSKVDEHRPIPTASREIDSIARTLHSWKSDFRPETPVMFSHLLQHQYSLASLRQGTLKGPDAQLLDILRSLAPKHKLRVYLANIELHLTGQGEDSGPPRRNMNIAEHEATVKMGFVESEEFTYDTVFDLEGDTVDFEVKTPKEEKTIKRLLRKRQPDEREYEGYVGNHGGEMEYWYRHTILMLWPDNRHNEVIGNYDILDDITTLEHSASSTATRREKTMSTRVLARAGPDSPHASRILETICGNAQRWNDLELWIQTIDTLGALKRPQIMGCSAIVAGVLTFGFDALRESLEKMISNSDDVPFNLELIDAITNAAPKGAMHVQEWCQDQRAVVIQSLLKALPESMDVLHVLIKHRDHQFFADHVAPHLIAARPGFLAFVKAMHVDREDLPEPMKLFLRSQAACLVLQGVEAAQALDTERTFESIDLCLHLLDSQAFSSFLQDLASATSDRDATLPLTERNRQIYGFYSRLMRDLQLLKRRMDARGEDKEPFDGYLREVVTGFLRGPIDAMKDASEVLIMAKAFQWTDDVGRSLVKETAIPVILSDIDRNTRLEVTVTAIHKLRTLDKEPQWQQRYKALVLCLIECAIESIGEIKTDDGKLPLTIVCLTCTLLRLCWATENKDMAPRVLERVLCVGDDYRSHFHNCLHLVLSELPSLATKYEADIGVFSEFVNSMFRRYISEVLGPKPPLPPSIPAEDAPDQKPQGLVDYTLWEEKRDLGHRVLQILKGEDLQRRALGPEGYAFVTSVLGVPDVPQPLANDAEKSTAGLAKQPPPQKKIIGPQSRVSQAHARDPLKPSQENHEGQHSVASFGPASKKRPLPRIRNKESSVATATEEPIRKRKKSRPSAESTVIDLTLSP